MLSKKVLHYPTTTIKRELEQRILNDAYDGIDTWDMTNRHKNIKFHEHTRSIPLITWDNIDGVHQWDTMTTHVTNGYPSKWPEVNAFMKLFEDREKCSVKIINIVRLLPDKPVHQHVDGGKFYEMHDRWHFVLQGEYDMIVEDTTFKYTSGGVYWFDNTKMHSVQNTDVERIAIIFDTLPV